MSTEFTPWKVRLAKMRRERRERSECDALIYHGPGHQSHTWCRRRGSHRVHEARYGSFSQFAQWRGKTKYTGYFDEPPAFRAGATPVEPQP